MALDSPGGGALAPLCPPLPAASPPPDQAPKKRDAPAPLETVSPLGERAVPPSRSPASGASVLSQPMVSPEPGATRLSDSLEEPTASSPGPSPTADELLAGLSPASGGDSSLGSETPQASEEDPEEFFTRLAERAEVPDAKQEVVKPPAPEAGKPPVPEAGKPPVAPASQLAGSAPKKPAGGDEPVSRSASPMLTAQPSPSHDNKPPPAKALPLAFSIGSDEAAPAEEEPKKTTPRWGETTPRDEAAE